MPAKARKDRSPLLTPRLIECPAVEVFSADSELVAGSNKIGWVSPELSGGIGGIVEKQVPAISVESLYLTRPALTSKICKAVGKSKAIRLAHLAHLLNHEKESFLAVVLVRGKLLAVSAYWYSNYGDWDVILDSVAKLRGWDAGRRVLSQV